MSLAAQHEAGSRFDPNILNANAQDVAEQGREVKVVRYPGHSTEIISLPGLRRLTRLPVNHLEAGPVGTELIEGEENSPGDHEPKAIIA